MNSTFHFPKTSNGENSTVRDIVICLCYDVTASDIRNAIDQSGARTAQEVAILTRAGNACGACKCRVERLLAGLPAECGPCSFCPGCGYIIKFCNCQSA
jgi:NAD(P)H-nitrite reductase large subunit